LGYNPSITVVPTLPVCVGKG